MDLDILGAQDRKYKEYVDSLKFEHFDIIKEMNDKRNFTATITAKRRSGKTVLLRNLIYEIRSWYSECWVFSETVEAQKEIYDFAPDDHIINNFDEEKLLAIWNSQKEKALKAKAEKKDIPLCLIVFDDIIGDKRVRNSKVLNNFFILGRHYGTCVIVLSQYIGGSKGLPPIVRSNCDFVVSFLLDAESDRELFIGQYLSVQSKKLGKFVYNKIANNVDYNAIVVLKCKIDPDIMATVKYYHADLNIPKFKIESKKDFVVKLKHRNPDYDPFASLLNSKSSKKDIVVKVNNRDELKDPYYDPFAALLKRR